MFDKLFLYTRSQQRGVIVLLFFIILLLLVRGILPTYYESSYEKEVTEYELYFNALNDSLKEKRDRGPQMFSFDPNLISKDDLRKLGFNAYQSKNLLSYRKAGGSFKKASDLKRIYGVDSAFYKKVSPFVNISVVPKRKADVVKRKVNKLNLNKVSYVGLMKLKGINSKLANRIINFRNALGGFYDMKQIDEVYGMITPLSLLIKKEFYVSSNDIQKIDLSDCNEKELAKHAYLNKKQSKLVLEIYNNCLEQEGDSSFYNQLIGNDLDKLIPYLKLD